jgi:hypothetical protein
LNNPKGERPTERNDHNQPRQDIAGSIRQPPVPQMHQRQYRQNNPTGKYQQVEE